MDWKDLSATLIRMGAPVIGTALGGPLGGTLGGILGSVVASFLGVEASPEAVQAAVTTMPVAEVRAALASADAQATNQWDAYIAIAKAQSDAAVAEAASKSEIAVAAVVGTQAVNETIREEGKASAAGGDGWLGKWRGIHAWELTLECPFWAGTAMYSLATGNLPAINGFVSMSVFLSIYFGSRFGVLGVHVWQGSNERQIGMTGIPAEVARAIKTAVKGK